MCEFKKYKRTEVAEIRAVCIEEYGEFAILVAKGIGIAKVDDKNGSPKEGDMLARNPKNHEDQWLIAADYFKENFEEIV